MFAVALGCLLPGWRRSRGDRGAAPSRGTTQETDAAASSRDERPQDTARRTSRQELPPRKEAAQVSLLWNTFFVVHYHIMYSSLGP